MPPVRIRYTTYEIGEHDIHVCALRDVNQFDEDYVDDSTTGVSSALWPIFGVVWPSSQVLAELMVRRELDGLRILEIGCGIGLTSLVANRRGADITATDLHPDAGAFLQRNTTLNEDPDIPFHQLDWGSTEHDTDLGRFDLIVGSDILYERDQIQDLSDFITRHSSDTCTVILVDPNRGRVGRMTRALEARGFVHGRIDVPEKVAAEFGEKVQVHSYTNSG